MCLLHFRFRSTIIVECSHIQQSFIFVFRCFSFSYKHSNQTSVFGMRGHTRSWIAFCGFPFEKKKIPSLSVALTFAAGAQLSIAIVGGVGVRRQEKKKWKWKRKRKRWHRTIFKSFSPCLKRQRRRRQIPTLSHSFNPRAFLHIDVCVWVCVCVCSHTFEDIVVRATLDYTAISSGPFKNGLF